MKSPQARGAIGVRISGTGTALPDKPVTNHDLAQRVDTNDEWITQRTGIKQRYIVDENTSTVDLATAAVQQALKNAGLDAQDLDLLLCATMTPEMPCPSTAARVVSQIGAVPAGAMDVTAACSGFVYCMNMASALLQTGAYKHIAVVGAEVLSSIVDWEDRRTCVLFGDGAGAAILSATDDPSKGCLYQSMSSNGDNWQDLFVPRAQRDIPQDAAAATGKLNTLQMNGREVYKFAVTTLQRSIDEALAACGYTSADLGVVIPHQSNRRILESARERLGLPEDKFCINIDRFGNTSAASVPICLHELTEQGSIKPNDLVLFVALGGGMTWASSLWKV